MPFTDTVTVWFIANVRASDGLPPLLTFQMPVLMRLLATQIAHCLVIVLRHRLSNPVNYSNPNIQAFKELINTLITTNKI